MKGLERYETLKAAVNIIAAAEKKCLTVGDRMAWAKLYRVEKYLLGQAGHVVEGRTEDGKEEGDVWALRVAAKALGVEEVERLTADGQVEVVVGAVLARKGWDAVEGGAR